MKLTKKCPKCDSTEIYTNADQTKRGDRASIPLSSCVALSISVYICAECGYMEEYVEAGDLKDSKKIEKLKGEFKRLV